MPVRSLEIMASLLNKEVGLGIVISYICSLVKIYRLS